MIRIALFLQGCFRSVKFQISVVYIFYQVKVVFCCWKVRINEIQIIVGRLLCCVYNLELTVYVCFIVLCAIYVGIVY